MSEAKHIRKKSNHHVNMLYFFFRPSSVFKTNTLNEATLPYKYCTSSTYTEKIYQIEKAQTVFLLLYSI